MRDRILVTILISLALVAGVFLILPGGAGALAVALVLAGSFLWVFRRYTEDKEFITTIFLGGLVARLAFGLFVHANGLRDFFGGDAIAYDFLGNELFLRWTDTVRIPNPTVDWQLNNIGAGWGMFDLVAAIYYVGWPKHTRGSIFLRRCRRGDRSNGVLLCSESIPEQPCG